MIDEVDDDGIFLEDGKHLSWTALHDIATDLKGLVDRGDLKLNGDPPSPRTPHVVSALDVVADMFSNLYLREAK